MPPKRGTPRVRREPEPEPEPEPDPQLESDAAVDDIDPELWRRAVATALAFKGWMQAVRAAKERRRMQQRTARSPRTPYTASPTPAVAVACSNPGGRAELLTAGVADWAPPWAAKYVRLASPTVGFLVSAVTSAWPYIVLICEWLLWAYSNTDPDLLRAAFGLWLCFFGGTFPVLIAAYEALQLSHGESTYSALCAITTEAQIIIQENAKDDTRDDDGDGIADVDKLDAKSLLVRKTRLVLTKCDPEKVNTAIAGLSATFLGVVATLKVEFAQTIAMSLSIAELLQLYIVDGRVEPLVQSIAPDEYRKWVPVLLRWLCKYTAYRVAWYCQSLVSAFTTGIRGGLLCSRAVLSFAIRRKWAPSTWQNQSDTYADEVLCYVLLALGIYYQVFVSKFSLPGFPLNLIFWPLSVTEESLKWHVTQS
eukprot:COSAG02_NODE_2483_length_8721_cov_37.896312_7_plen_422_part_00